MFRGRPHTKPKYPYTALDRNGREPDSAYLYNNGVERFSPSASMNEQSLAIKDIWLGIDSLTKEPDFSATVKLYNLHFIDTAEKLRSHLTDTPYCGRSLFRLTMCTNSCYYAALLHDITLIDEQMDAQTTPATELHQLKTLIQTVLAYETRESMLQNTDAHQQLARMDHDAARHLLSYLQFLQLVQPYYTDMKTLLLGVKSHHTSNIPSSGSLFSRLTDNWVSEIEAALHNITADSHERSILIAYELTLNVLLDTGQPKKPGAFYPYKELLDTLSLTRVQACQAARQKASS